MSKRALSHDDEVLKQEKREKKTGRRKYVNGEKPLTNAERVRRYREARAAKVKANPEIQPAKIQMNVWIASASREKLRAVAERRGISVGKLIEALADEVYEQTVAERAD